MKTVLILGVTGQTGCEVANQLAENPDIVIRGAALEVETQNLPDGLIPLEFSWENRATWQSVIDTKPDGVYLVRPEIEFAPALMSEFLAQLSGSPHVVLLSGRDADMVPSSFWTARVEAAVTNSVVRWTIVRPDPFMQVFTDRRYFGKTIRTDDVIMANFGDGAIAFVDVRDIAEVVVRALVDDGHESRVYSLTGPSASSLGDVANELTRLLGRKIRYIDTPVEEARESFRELPEWRRERAFYGMDRTRSGGHSTISVAIEAVTGHPPRSLEDFLTEHRPQWTRSTPASST
ncbi:hypothetical protein ACQPZ2_29730 [Nocardia pseudovaccinii]|uniref:hypothetical protein n=1 Tax=Nocardia pseudovaccinii TaxID=189540 RepID=UPI003D933B82